MQILAGRVIEVQVQWRISYVQMLYTLSPYEQLQKKQTKQPYSFFIPIEFWPWLDCWCYMSWCEYFWNCWFPGIFTHNSLLSYAELFEKKKNIHWVIALQTEMFCCSEVGAERKNTVTQITTLYNWDEHKSISESTTPRTLRFLWATPVADHIRFPSCQPRTEIWGCSGNRFTKTGQMKMRKT